MRNAADGIGRLGRRMATASVDLRWGPRGGLHDGRSPDR
jgi:hypothetical protein